MIDSCHWYITCSAARCLSPVCQTTYFQPFHRCIRKNYSSCYLGFFFDLKMNPENSNPTRRSRNPSCTLCGNHGVRSELKNHKHKCPYNSCACRLCDRGRERREVMRKQVRLRRQQMKQIYSKGYNKSKRGNCALGLDNNPPKTKTNHSFAASSNMNIVPAAGKLKIFQVEKYLIVTYLSLRLL